MSGLIKIFVELNEGTKDYVTGYLYKGDKLVKTLEDIRKPDNLEDYTSDWKNGLYNEYKHRAILSGYITTNDIVVYI